MVGSILLPDSTRVLMPSDEDRLIDVAEFAARESLHLITDGYATILCSIIPAGWRKFAVKHKPPALATQEPPCDTAADDEFETFSHGQENYGTSKSTRTTRVVFPFGSYLSR